MSRIKGDDNFQIDGNHNIVGNINFINFNEKKDDKPIQDIPYSCDRFRNKNIDIILIPIFIFILFVAQKFELSFEIMVLTMMTVGLIWFFYLTNKLSWMTIAVYSSKIEEVFRTIEFIEISEYFHPEGNTFYFRKHSTGPRLYSIEFYNQHDASYAYSKVDRFLIHYDLKIK